MLFYLWSGNNGEKVTPVPIPNTEVKLLSADGSEGLAFGFLRGVLSKLDNGQTIHKYLG